MDALRSPGVFFARDNVAAATPKNGSILAVRCLQAPYAVTIVRDFLRRCQDDIDFARDVRASGEVEADAASAHAEQAPLPPRILQFPGARSSGVPE